MPQKPALFSADDAFALTPALSESIRHAIVDEVAYYEGMSDHEIESDLWKRFNEDIAFSEEDPYPYPAKLGKNAKWRVVSSLQKAVRRGDTYHALRAVAALVNGGEGWYMWHRIRVVALEDIGLANPSLAMLVYFLSANKQLIKEMGELMVSSYVVEAMCRTVKDRTLVDLVYSSHAHPTLIEQKEDWVTAYEADELWEGWLPPFASDFNMLLVPQRMSALMGTLHSPSNEKKKSKNSAKLVAKRLPDLPLPTALEYLVRLCMSTKAEGLWYGLPMIWHHMMNANEGVKVKAGSLPEAPVLRNLPSPAFDQHTMEGKRAYAYFLKACSPVAEKMSTQPWKEMGVNPVMVVGSAVFEVEGQQLHHRLDYGISAKLHKYSLDTDAGRYQVPYEWFMELVSIVGANLETLNKSRARVLEPK